jgi:hypothetical protein
MANKDSVPEWKRKRGWLNRTLEKVEDFPVRAFTRDRPITDSARREIYEKGIVGQAEILEAPSERRVSEVSEADGAFRFRVEVPGREPYEVKSWQKFGRYSWERMRPGALVECRVHPDNEQRVLLCPPEPGELPVSMMDSSQIVAEGKRATATVSKSAKLDKTAPGSGDPLYVMNLELRSDAEPEPWKVQIGQRVPKGAENLIADGSNLQVAYIEVDKGDSVAVDWVATTAGRFS